MNVAADCMDEPADDASSEVQQVQSWEGVLFCPVSGAVSIVSRLSGACHELGG